MNSNYSTMLLLAIKEIRHDRNVHQGHLAQWAGKSPNAWTKIENGQSPLTTDAFFGVCAALAVYPSYMMSTVERLVSIFNSANCLFHSNPLPEGEDDILKLVVNYFNSRGYEALKLRPYERVSVEANNLFSGTSLPTAVRYCLEPEYRKWIDDGAPLGAQGLI